MIKKIITFSVLIAVILGQENSFLSLVPAKDVVLRLKDSLSNPLLIHTNICFLTDEDWQTIKEVSIQYLIDTQSVNYQTGSFNLTYLDEIATPQERDNFFASQCEESYNEEEDMDSKIAVIFKGSLLRGGECGYLPGKAEACKEYLGIVPKDTSPGFATEIPALINSNTPNDTDAPATPSEELGISSIETTVASSTNYDDDHKNGDKKKRSRGSGQNRNRSHQKKSHSKKSHVEKSHDKKSHAEKSHDKNSHAKKSRVQKSHEEKPKH